MGRDKGGILIDGQPIAVRIANALGEHCHSVTVLGREPLPGFKFLRDEQDYAGPLATIARFDPMGDAVFLAACDLPRFDGRLVPEMAAMLEGHDSVIPIVAGHYQPTCALYTAKAWASTNDIRAAGSRSLMAWLDTMDCRPITTQEISNWGIDPRACRGANTPEELAELLAEDSIDE